MLEVCFSDSVKASLAWAQNCGNELHSAASIVFESCPRKDYIYDAYSFDRYNDCEYMEKSIDTFWSSIFPAQMTTHPTISWRAY